MLNLGFQVDDLPRHLGLLGRNVTVTGIQEPLAILRGFEPTPHHGRVIEHGLIRVAAKPRFDLLEMVHAVQQVRARDLGPLRSKASPKPYSCSSAPIALL